MPNLSSINNYIAILNHLLKKKVKTELARIIIIDFCSPVVSIESLTEFIINNPDPRELKRSLAVKMIQQNYSYYQIRDTLGVSVGFISNCHQKFEREGVKGLKLKHKGSNGYLTIGQKQEVLDWLKSKNYWQLLELETYIEVNYGVRFASFQSYYSLFSEAVISWKKTQKSNPRKNPDLVSQKKLKLKPGWRRIEKKS